MVDVIQAWLRANEPAMIAGTALMPRSSDGAPGSPRCSASEDAVSYYLTDKNDDGWILKKFTPESQPDFSRAQIIPSLIPKIPGFKSGFDRRVLDNSSLLPAGYYTEELQTWLSGAVLIPEVNVSTWAEVTESIREGGETLSTIVKLFLCQKLSESVECLESAGVAHTNLSGQSVLIDPLNIEIHFTDWDCLYHPGLGKPASWTSGAVGYIAPFVKAEASAIVDSTWKPMSDRFALAVMNCEILLLNRDSPRTAGGGLLEQQHIFDRAGQTLERLRNALQRNSRDALHLFDQCLTASNFDQCPGPREWRNLIERELKNDVGKSWDEGRSPAQQSHSIYDRPRTPGFAVINKSALVKINRNAFVSAPRRSRY